LRGLPSSPTKAMALSPASNEALSVSAHRRGPPRFSVNAPHPSRARPKGPLAHYLPERRRG